MKILVLLNQLQGPKITTGGEISTLEIVKRWKSDELFIFCPKSAARTIEKEIKPKKIYGLENTKYEKEDCTNLFTPFLFFVYFLRTFETIKKLKMIKENFDIVYASGDFFCNILPAVWLKKRNPKIKFIAKIHHESGKATERKNNPFIRSFFGRGLQQFSWRKIKKYADLTLALNPRLKKSLLDLGFNPQKIKLVTNGIDYNFIQKIKPDPEFTADAVYLGRINFTKGAFDLPEIWANVVAKIPNTKLNVLGSGSINDLKNFQENLIKFKMEKQIKFLGPIEGEKRFAIIKAAKIFLFPSYEESWPLVVAEAMANGLPVVGYNLPSYKEAFENFFETAPIGDKKGIANLAIKLLNNENLRKQISQKEKEIIQKYDWKIVAQKERKIINEARTN